MSENENPVVEQNSGESGMALAVYILYLVGLVFGITFLIGVVLAYVSRGSAPGWLASHYSFQIRTFWIGFLFTVVSILTTFIFVGYLLLLLSVIWLIVRCAKGISALNRRQPIGNVETWMFP